MRRVTASWNWSWSSFTFTSRPVETDEYTGNAKLSSTLVFVWPHDPDFYAGWEAAAGAHPHTSAPPHIFAPPARFHSTTLGSSHINGHVAGQVTISATLLRLPG
ncbi:hypothetical protein BU17DRAFT_81961 [Hysterangium stoloniferum]|nr:hypothetical protein BU17DRAFT_81961 [Hysterangium stoloniferum]